MRTKSNTHPSGLDRSPRLRNEASLSESRRSNLRIVIVTESFLPAINGVTNSVLRVIEHMTLRGHTVDIIAPGPCPSSYGESRVYGIPSVGLPTYPGIRIGYSRSLTRSLLESMQPDVIHVASPTVLGAIAVSEAKKLGIPVIAIYQTDLAGFVSRYHLGVASRGIWRHLARVHKKASLTLAPSTDAVWALRGRGVDNAVRWMRGVDPFRFHPSHRDESLRTSLAPNGEIIVGNVGRLAREKRLDLLVPLSELPNVRLVIVGDGPMRQSLQKLMPRAIFVGFQSGNDLSRYFASLDIFVHAGADETFCQAIQEALCSGVPVVAPASGGPLDLVQHGFNGYLWNESTKNSFLGAVKELVHHPVKRERMATNARGSVEERTWSTIMDELEGHYQSTVDGLGYAYRELMA